VWGLLPRSTQTSIVVVLVVCTGWLLSATSTALLGTPISPLKSTSLVGTLISVVVFGGFGVCWRWVWRRVPVLSRWFPDLTGRWEGTYLSSYRHENGQHATGPFTAIIRLGLFTSSVTAWTGEMRSHSTRSWLEADRDAKRFAVGYTYRSIPNAAVRERSAPHDGVCFLTMIPDNEPECLRGIYYTERRTIGDITLRRTSGG
jgi:hypothetical protein